MSSSTGPLFRQKGVVRDLVDLLEELAPLGVVEIYGDGRVTAYRVY